MRRRIAAVGAAMVWTIGHSIGAWADTSAERIVFINAGGGPQPGGGQVNRTVGIDYEFWKYERTARQKISIGVSYTYLASNSRSDKRLHAIGFYPQLTLTPVDRDRFARFLPADAMPYFFVRALGPSYISENRLGERDQAEHFSFQALVGVGLRFGDGDDESHLTLAWKHFSNANLFSENDGIDMPIVLSFGKRF